MKTGVFHDNLYHSSSAPQYRRSYHPPHFLWREGEEARKSQKDDFILVLTMFCHRQYDLSLQFLQRHFWSKSSSGAISACSSYSAVEIDTTDVATYTLISLLWTISKCKTSVQHSTEKAANKLAVLAQGQLDSMRTFRQWTTLYAKYIARKVHVFNITAYTVFVDFKRHPAVELSWIWKALELCKVDENLIKAIQLL